MTQEQEKQQRDEKLLGYLAAHAPEDLAGYKPIVSFMTVDEVAGLYAYLKSPLAKRVAQIYRVKGKEEKKSESLAIMFAFLTSEHTARYWKSHKGQYDALQQDFTAEWGKYAIDLNGFDQILQTKEYGLLAMPKAIRPLAKALDTETTEISVKSDSVRWIVDTFMAGQISNTTLRLLTVLLSKTEKIRDMGVFISWEEYADYAGMKKTDNSIKEIREQMLEDAEILSSARYEVRRKDGKVVKVPLYGGLSFDETRKQRGGLYWVWSPVVYGQFDYFAPVDIPRELYKANMKSSTYPLGVAICMNRRFNEGKRREKKMTVKNLLKSATTIPTIEELQKAGNKSSAKQKIVQAFWKALDNAGDWLLYTVHDKDGNEVADPMDLSYEDFIESYIMVDYSEFPEHEERVENREKHKAKRRKKGGEKSQKGG